MISQKRNLKVAFPFVRLWQIMRKIHEIWSSEISSNSLHRKDACGKSREATQIKRMNVGNFFPKYSFIYFHEYIDTKFESISKSMWALQSLQTYLKNCLTRTSKGKLNDFYVKYRRMWLFFNSRFTSRFFSPRDKHGLSQNLESFINARPKIWNLPTLLYRRKTQNVDWKILDTIFYGEMRRWEILCDNNEQTRAKITNYLFSSIR